MKTALITGISKGIGRALTEKFLIEGYRVISTTRDGTNPFTHPHLLVHVLELTSPDSISRCSEDIWRLCEIGNFKIDIFINNAGALFDEEETKVVQDKLRKTLEVNLIGTIDFTEHIIPLLDNEAHIINISSSAGSLAKAGIEDEITSHFPLHYPAYKISKCALNMYTRTLAAQLSHKKSNIIVSSVHPGWVKTEMGGENADLTPEESAQDIFDFAITRPETGHFWHKGKKFPW